MVKLKQLKEIQGNIAKKQFLDDNRKDKVFVECLRFLIDDLVITNISSKKYNKELELNTTMTINNVSEMLDYLKESSGRDIDIINIKSFINKQNDKDKIILEGLVCKNYSIGFGIKFFNQVITNDKIITSPYQGCSQFSEDKVNKLFKENNKLYSQIKQDGQYVNAIIKKSGIVFTARSGIIQYINGRIKDELILLRNFADMDFVITGELLIDGYDRKTANGIIRGLISSNKKISEGSLKEADKFKKKYKVSIEEIEDKLKFVTWDFVDYECFIKGVDKMKYKYRLRTLETLVLFVSSNCISVTEYKIVNTYSQAIQHFKELLSKGEEGSVIKTLDFAFKDGKPSYIIKLKVMFDLDLRIVGFNKGKPRTKYANTLGSLQVESENGLLSTNMSGIKDKIRDEIWNNKEDYINKIVVVKCNGISTNRQGGTSLLFPNFLHIREDKLEANTLDEILKIQQMKLELN